MFTLHITHDVTDYEAWKTAFDTYDRVRRENGVLGYRIARGEPGARRLHIDLDFGTRDQAESYTSVLDGIWSLPQAKELLPDARSVEILDLVDQQSLR